MKKKSLLHYRVPMSSPPSFPGLHSSSSTSSIESPPLRLPSREVLESITAARKRTPSPPSQGSSNDGTTPFSDPSQLDRIVQLNIGGVRYTTSARTLLNYGARGEPNFFAALLSGALPSAKDASGAFFVDRDGIYFEPILSFLRTGFLHIPPHLPRATVMREAAFYLIDLTPSLPASAALIGDWRDASSLRMDGVYLQKTQFASYVYLFLNGGRVRVMCHEDPLLIGGEHAYDVVEQGWLVIRWSRPTNDELNQQAVTLLSIHDTFLSLECKMDLSKRTGPSFYAGDLHSFQPINFFRSFEPVIGVRFFSATGGWRYIMFVDADHVTIRSPSADGVLRSRTAPCSLAFADHIWRVQIQDEQFPFPFISLGVVLLELMEAEGPRAAPAFRLHWCAITDDVSLTATPGSPPQSPPRSPSPPPPPSSVAPPDPTEDHH